MKRPDKRYPPFHEKLLVWYEAHHRKLPWRETRVPYRIWVSEIMLQQTTVQVVIPYYEKWIRQFPDAESLSRAPLQKVLKAWQGLGYYQRARHLHRASQIIVEKFEGRIPQDYEELKKLPGIGPYTAAAILSLAFDKPYPVVDANVRRVLMRLMRIQKEARSDNDDYLLQTLRPLLPHGKMGFFNQAMMELGSLICRSKNPSCLLCPVQEFCKAYETGEQETIPVPKQTHYEKIEAVVGIVEKQGKYLIQRRPPTGLLAGLWEFPGGKKRKDESLEQALRREISEELGADVENTAYLTRVNHAYTKFHVTLHVFECTIKAGPRLKKGVHRWTSLNDLKDFPLPAGSVKIVQFLEERE
jgi:A/G-specific adenine glycosylase